ncbi:hypothetical protein LPJ64_000414 [Coemansia asiatica]|uniref:HIT domain-containing protein n=1 Tax=Coemansia asiatica TaxID=1052880 RepID=A0A9W7XSK3_9FUNG|nr:hypothetical protein LPJ64_000414 [Coemansia asiatica]KAJ2854319.1 hypothetical protein FB639_006391 [Coemansia asiatica]
MVSSRSILFAAIGIIIAYTFGYRMLIRGQYKPKNCVFCNALDRIVYEDDEFIAFHDIKPDAALHLLVIPRVHFGTIKELKPEDLPMIGRMQDIGKRLLEEQGFSGDNARFGFHRPPFNSIHHLHMHCLGLPFKPKRAEKMFPKNGSRWFMTTAQLVEKMSAETAP